MEDETILIPFYAFRVSIPEHKGTKVAHQSYKPSNESLALKSEKGRTVFAEAIIEDRKLGTLAELCIRSLAHGYVIPISQMLPTDKLTLRTFYDSIDIESPLEKIYKIEDKLFWKRLVFAKSSDFSYRVKGDDAVDWKGLGISLKYAELVEKCPAEFWPEAKMVFLAQLVKDYVKELHIKELQPLQDYMFQRYMLRDSETDKSDSTDVSSSTSGDQEFMTSEREEFLEEEEQRVYSNTVDNIKTESVDSEEARSDEVITEDISRTRMLQAEWNDFAAKRNEEKLKLLEERKQERRIRREKQQLRRQRREEKILERRLLEETPKPKKKIVRNVFDLPIDEPDDLDSKIIDKRNLERVIKQKKLYDYPPKHCHHVDLRFVRLFDNLEDLSIIFHPPKLETEYHSRYFKFSYDDIDRLARGISELQCLRIFRLRESRMDERKLRMLTSILKDMSIEVIDFGYDYLEDDCDDAIWDLFQNTTTIKSLELEGNYMKTNVMKCLAFTLNDYAGHLEYLGLARNPLNDEAIHTLCKMLPNMNQVNHLNLAGIKLSESVLSCCIANELLRKNKALAKLDLVGIPIDNESGVEIVKALQQNYSIQYVNCRGCGLPLEIEFEIEVFIRRNRFMAENPYIGDDKKTEKEIREFCERQKNPIIIKVTESIEAQKICLENRPEIAERYSLPSVESRTDTYNTSALSSTAEQNYPEVDFEEQEEIVEQEKFTYDPNEFTLEQINAQVLLPGPPQRYRYFHPKKEYAP